MATKAMNMANDQQTGELQTSSEKEENNCDDDRNNNAQDKVIPKLSILKINESFSKIEKLERKDSAKPSHLCGEPSMNSGLKDDDLKIPSSKNLTPLNDRKSEELKSSFSILHHSRNYSGSNRGSAVLPLLTSEPVKDETGNDFTDYFSMSMSGAEGSKTLVASSGGTSKPESENAKSALSEHLAAMSSKSVTPSSATTDLFGSGHLPALLDMENITRNRPKSANPAASQAGPVKPRCTPAREAVDPAKYFTLTDEPDGTKYACSKCGNVYKWRKSLNKHWKEKHDGEIPNLHARPPPSLLQRERFLNPLRGPQKHSVFHQPGFHGPGSKSTTAPVISPPRLSSMHAGKNSHGMSPYLFGKFPIKDDGKEAGKGAIHQVEEPATAVVRPSRSNHSPNAPHRWTNWLSSTTGRPILDLPSPQKLKIPTVESIKSAHDHTQSRDSFGQMFTAIQGHHTLRGGPLDLSGTLVSRSSADDDNVLDLSRKGGSDVLSLSNDCGAVVQDEPLDFSTKSHGKHLGYPKHGCTTSSDSSFSASWFPVAEKKDSILPKAMDYSDIGLESGKGSLFLVNDYDKPGQVFCACCKLSCKSVADLNHHFARNHTSALYEASVDVGGSGSGSGSGSSANQLLKHLAWESAKKTLACVVCGMSVQWSWMLAKHFEQVHSSVQPNPYKKTSSSSSSSAASSASVTGAPSHLDSGANPAAAAQVPATHRCETCPFVTDSFAEFSRHQLKHSLVKEKKTRQESSQNHSGYLQTSDDDHSKDPVVSKRTSAMPFNQFDDEIIDLEGENTAIVIPQAPEETYLEGAGGCRYQNEESGPDDSPPAYAKLPFESGMVISGENTAIVIPQAPEDASALSSSALYSTPSGSKVSRSKKDAGPTTESLLPFKCELCEYRARWPSEMMQHMKNHSDEKPYQCPQCSYRSKWKWDVVKHLKRCGGGGSVKDVIDTTLRRKSFVKSLLIDPHSLQSTYDGVHHPSYGSMSFSGYYSDQSNPSKLHDVLLKGPPNVTVYSGMNDSNNGSPEEEAEGYEICDDSEDTVSEDMSLGRSEQGNEAAGQNGGHGCTQCPFVGHSPAELKRHLRVHSDEKPYCCRTCNYSSKWKCDLKKHLKAYDHVSGVPLSYGGHGKKPAAWSQIVREMSGGSSGVEFEDSDLKLLLQGGKRDPGLDRPLSRDGGNLFGGITSGGRLRCKQCEFEAIDITSFLQHKKMHRSGEVRKRDGVAIKRKSPLPSHHHRRKSFKQTRVLPTETGGRELSEKGGAEGNVKIIDVADPEEHRAETNRFWESLGLQSISSARHKRQSSTGESDDTCDDPDSSDPEAEFRYGSSSRCADLSRGGEFVKQFSQVSSNSYESSSDIETETLEANEDGNCPGGGKGEMELEGMEEVEKFSAGNHLKETKASLVIKSPFQVVRRGLRQGVTTTEAEDAAGMSKRKRKLRTCEKCGYITDNLTTLQRHAAKHGSGGRHRCWMCDYSVDRQHVLEYHVKIVHKGADRSAETKPEEPNRGTKAEIPNKISAENFLERSNNNGVDGNSVFERGSFGGKRKIVCTTSVIMVRGHEMEMIQKGNKTWYNCIKCHFVSSNITNAVNHAKQHGANKRYRCKHCDYSLDRKSSIANHMYSQHSQPDAFQFEIGAETDLLKPGQWPGGLRRGKIQRLRYSLLDRMGSHWKKHTCIRCGFSSINPGRMSLHRLTHGRLDKEYGCKACGYRTTSYRLLARHVTSHGLTDGSRGIDLSVVHCGSSASSVQTQRREDDVSAPKTSGPETSNGSGKVTDGAEAVSTRDEKIRDPKRIRCRLCPFASFSAQRSVVHAKHHNSLKKLACGECSFRADVRNVLLHHKKLHR